MCLLTGNAAHIFTSVFESSLHSKLANKLISCMNGGFGGGGIINFGGGPGPSQASMPQSKFSSIMFHIKFAGFIFKWKTKKENFG